MAPTYRGMKWPVLPEDAVHFVIGHVYDVLDRLATTVEVLATLASSQDTEIAEKANFAISQLQKYRRVHPILYLIIGLPAPTSIPKPASSSELTALHDEVKELKALVATIKSAPPPQHPKPAVPTFVTVTATTAPKPTSCTLCETKPTPNPTNPPTMHQQTRPRLVLQVKKPAPGTAQTSTKMSPLEISGKLASALQASVQHSQVCISAVKWTASGNLVAFGGPDTTTDQLLAASNLISSTLQPHISVTSSALDTKWSKVVLHGIPTGVSLTLLNPFSTPACHAELNANNQIYWGLKITQLPSWVRKPSSYSPGSSSSLVFAFEDPDGSVLRTVLASSPFYAFGAVAEARRWKAKPHAPAPKKLTTVTHIHNSASRPQGGEIDVQMDISVPHTAPVSTGSVTDDAADLTSTPPAKKRKKRHQAAS
jgi:hypothetical protein